MEEEVSSNASTFITALLENFSPADLWNEISGVALFLASLIIFAFALWLVIDYIRNYTKFGYK